MNAFSSFSNSARWIIAILGVLNLLCITALWLGRPGGPIGPPNGPPRGLIRKLSTELQLSAEQKQRFALSFNDHHEKMQSFRKSIDQLREQQLQLMTQTTVDSVALESLYTQIGIAHSNRERVNYQHYRELHDTCTPEQRVKLRKLFRSNAPRGGHPPH